MGAYKGIGRVDLKTTVQGNRRKDELCPTYAFLCASLAKEIPERSVLQMNSLYFLSILFFIFSQLSVKSSTPTPNLISQLILPLPNKVPPSLFNFDKLKCLRY